MSLNGFADGTPYIRLPVVLHNTLANLPREGSEFIVNTALALQIKEVRADRWRLIRLFGPGGQQAQLTEVGLVVRSFVDDYLTKKRQRAPMIPLAEFVRRLPEHHRQWLFSGSTPLSEYTPAPFLEAVGVLCRHWGATSFEPGYYFTEFGEKALSLLKDFGTDADDDYSRDGMSVVTADVFDPKIKSVMLGALNPDGLPILRANAMGRELRPYMAIGILTETADSYVVPSQFRDLVRRLVNSRGSSTLDIFTAFPAQDQQWFLSSMISPPTCQRDILFEKLGWVHVRSRKGNVVKPTKYGVKLRDWLDRQLYALETAKRHEAGPGVDLYLPQEDDALDTDDPFDMLDMGEPGERAVADQVIEALSEQTYLNPGSDDLLADPYDIL